MDLKTLSTKPSGLVSGHLTCAGCGIPQVVRTVLRSISGPKIIVNATGCLEVTTTIYPTSSWTDPYIHTAFPNAAATASGIETALNYLEKHQQFTKTPKPTVVVFAGDGGTYDIGFQALSGAIERGHNFLYVCYDNEAYMNTGVQRSSATPQYAATTTTPVDFNSPGKIQWRKLLTEIIAAHRLPYVAQASISHLTDLSAKVEKAIQLTGLKYITVLQPCTLGWRYPSEKTISYAKLAVETRFWPLFEVVLENGQPQWSLTVDVPNPKPVTDWLKGQGRFKHLFEKQNAHLLEEIQTEVDRRWQELTNKIS